MDPLLLSKHEKQLLPHLTREGSHPQKVVRRSGVPNASAYLAFDKLVQRGFAYKKKRNHKVFWGKAEGNDIRYALSRAQESITGESTSHIKLKTGSDIIVHLGREPVRGLVHRILDMHEGSRVTIFQSANADSGWADLFETEEVIRINEGLADGKIVFESIIPTDYFDKIIPEFGLDWAHSYADRPNIVHSFPPEFSLSRAEIHMYNDIVIIFDMNEFIGIEIKNKQIKALIQGLMQYIVATTPLMDVNKEISKFE